MARVPTSSGVLFPPPSGGLEGDGLGAGAVCTLKPIPLLFVRLLRFLRVAKGFFGMLQQMIFECCNRVIHVLQKGSSNVGIVVIGDFNC